MEMSGGSYAVQVQRRRSKVVEARLVPPGHSERLGGALSLGTTTNHGFAPRGITTRSTPPNGKGRRKFTAIITR